MNYHNWTALRHDNIGLSATAAAALAARQAAGFFYRGLYFNASGIVDVVDTQGNLESVTVVAGGVYPLQNCGVVQGGGTTLTQGQFLALYD